MTCFPWFPLVAERVPCAEQGIAKVDRITITEDDAKFANLRSAFSGRRSHVQPGEYTRLLVNSKIIMSDTYDEQQSNLEIKHQVEYHIKHFGKCRVLISGLGLGMIMPPLLEMGADITILELHEDVIDLIAPHYYSLEQHPGQLEIIHADAFTWKIPRGLTWDLIYHDIWFDICTDNLDELTKLKRRFARRLNRPNGEQWGWEEDRLRYEKRRYC
jgi:hypothetical protein